MTLPTRDSYDTQDTFQIAILAAQAADEKKAQDTLLLETAHVSELADYFLICTGESPTQIKAISESIRRTLKDEGLLPIGEERKSSTWHLLDYGDFIVHVMHPEERHFYQLENFWSHADRVPKARWADLKAS